MNLYVGNLSYEVSEDDLRNAFAEHGDVSSAKIISDRMTGRSKGFGFVEMPNDNDARSALEALNDVDLKGRNLKVSEARPREERPQRRQY